MQKLDMLTPDMVAQNIAAIAKLFPNIITEQEDADGNITKAIDYDLFRQMFSRELVEWSDERYRLDWPGKRASILKANTPIEKTLRPVVADSVNWDTTENLYIEWDNFEVLKVLQESYLGKVKMIYIDPPYNTGTDFVYKDDFKISREVYEEWLEIINEEWGRLIRNTDTNGRFHSDWLSMMYERLVVARDLLRDDGVIFISIDDGEVNNLKKICDEIFGEDNFIGTIARLAKTTSDAGKHYAPSKDYIITFCKNIANIAPFREPLNLEDIKQYNKNDKNGKYKTVGFYQASLTLERSRNARYFIDCPTGEKCIPPENKRWRCVKETYLVMLEKGEIEFIKTPNSPLIDEKGNKSEWNVYTKQYLDRRMNEGKTPRDYLDTITNVIGTKEIKSLEIPFDFPKPTKIIEHLAKIIDSKSDDIILDFFSGSATTAHAVMQLNAEDGGNRKYIMVQIPEETDKAGYQNICEIGKERIRRAGKKIVEENKDREGIEKLDTGFRVYRLDSSNMKDVFYHPTQVTQAGLFDLTSNIKDDRTPEDILAQVMLDLGLTLDLPIETRTIAGSRVFLVAGNSLVACFDEEVDFSIVDELAGLSPLKVVFRDSSFQSDADRINFETRFKKLSPDSDLRVI